MKRFKSRVDGWYYAIILIAAIPLSLALLGPRTTEEMVILGVSMLVAVGLPVWFLFTTHYDIEKEHLIVRCGPLRWEIAVAEITSVEASSSLLSSPALSLRRLKINYGNNQWLLISPADIPGFRTALGFEE